MVDFKKIAEQAATYQDQSVAKAFGGDREPPAAGPCRLRMVGYVETGKHAKTWQGKTKHADQVEVTFEVSGPKHPPVIGEDGTKYPLLITIKEGLSTSDKARYFKLFRALNYSGKFKHGAQALGEAYKGRIVHREYTRRKDGTKGIAVELFDKATGAFTIEPPRYEVVNGDDHENPGPTGEYKPLKVDPAITPLRCFVWALADQDQWDSIFIDGEYEQRTKDDGTVIPAKSKNVIQAKIMSAINFQGSPIHQLLVANGACLDIPDVDTPDEPGDEEDPPAQPPSPAVKAAAAGPKDPPARTTVKAEAKADPLAGIDDDIPY
jgi:hypothetical protein